MYVRCTSYLRHLAFEGRRFANTQDKDTGHLGRVQCKYIPVNLTAGVGKPISEQFWFFHFRSRVSLEHDLELSHAGTGVSFKRFYLKIRRPHGTDL